MTLAVGTKLGPYEILAPIGAGGMGEVYRARDPRVGRDVAIKVSAAKFSERFEREARAVAALNHPNICTLHDVGPDYIVMELVEGETLAERIQQGAMPLEESLAIARQIADALEAAHEKGIIHRDLKPGNIKIRPDGTVKVLDFGLAKVTETQDTSLSHSPTLSRLATQQGIILGTAGYMSPEQARGKPVDKRADIWAFGVVLYEMLAGKCLFEGEDVAETLAAVINKEPDYETVPCKVRSLLRNCLEKDPKRRLRDIADAWRLLDERAQFPPQAGSRRHRPWIAWGAAALCFLVALALTPVVLMHLHEAPPLVRTSVLPPESTTFAFETNLGPPAISPDGRRLVFAATSSDGKSRLWVRSLDTPSAQPLPGTENGTFPFWSPDGRFVAFQTSTALKKIDVSGGPPVPLSDRSGNRGGSWSSEGVIVFASGGALNRISAAGGTPIPATTISETNGTNHRFPWFLPDGKHFIYSAQGRNSGDRLGRMILNVGSLDSDQSKMIGQTDSNAQYADGHLLFLRGDTLMAQPFDPKRLETTGEAIPIAEQVRHVLSASVGFFSVSTQGTLVFQAGAATGGRKLTWFDRTGKPGTTVGEAADIGALSFSPDRKRLAAIRVDQSGSGDIWIYDLDRGLPGRFTFDLGIMGYPVWSNDAHTIAFAAGKVGQAYLYKKSSNGTGIEEPLTADKLFGIPTSWSPDDKYLLYHTFTDPKSGFEIWALALSGDRKPFLFIKNSPFGMRWGQFSPDGRWVAYCSNESGREEIYVVPFRPPGEAIGGKQQISTAGGNYPRWRGNEIFYASPDRRLMAVEVSIKGDTLRIGTTRALFGPIGIGSYDYDVSSDGQRILAAVAPEQKSPEPLTLVQNWTAGLKK